MRTGNATLILQIFNIDAVTSKGEIMSNKLLFKSYEIFITHRTLKCHSVHLHKQIKLIRLDQYNFRYRSF